MAKAKDAEKPFKKISELEYEIQVAGRTKVIKAPFEKVSLVFKAFIANGGVIDPITGQVNTDILSLISSFKDVGNVLLTEYGEDGKVIEEGSCSCLATKEVIALFTLATHLIQDFMKEMSEMQTAQAPAAPKEDEEEK